MKVCLLASGSKGNALYVTTGETRLLIDAGLSAIELLRRLARDSGAIPICALEAETTPPRVIIIVVVVVVVTTIIIIIITVPHLGRVVPRG